MNASEMILMSEEESDVKNKKKNNKKQKYEKISENSQNDARIISSRGTSRLLFGDISI